MTAPNPKEALELLPCPFCGGNAEFSEKRLKRRTYVVCASCHTTTRTRGDHSEAAKHWNTRAALAALKPEGELSGISGELPDGERREALQQLIMKSQDCGYGDEDTNGKHRRMFCDDDSLSSYHRSAKCDCRAVFDAILASGLVQDEAGWRDISTAPKDGTVIDVWLGDADGSDLDFYCQSRTCKRSANWYWSNGKFRPFTGLDLPLTTFVEPTHWIPLPAPPIRSARNGGAET